MKKTELKKIIREMIEDKNEEKLRKELETRVMGAFRKVAVPFKDKTAEPHIKSIISSLENIIADFKQDHNL
jgi:hypothetical protein